VTGGAFTPGRGRARVRARAREARPGGDGAAPPAIAVEAHDLRKRYGEFTAVDGIEFEVRPRECYGFLGPNGAGKTTTMKMIYGLAAVDGGDLRVLGLDARTARREIKSRIGVVPQEGTLDSELNVRENLAVHAQYHGLPADGRVDELLRLALLEERAGSRPRELSGGMKRRLLIVRALVNEPELVVLDEPTTGLDPQARLAVWDMLGRMKSDGVTLIVTTHYMEEAERICDRVAIMDEGRIVAEGSPAELRERCDQPTLEGVFLHLTGHRLRE
jgi:lipooligosaccharide transport system ATP-binding protein